MNKDVKPKAIPTLADVARAAGVSTATVSRAINFPDQVVEKTRIKVNAAIDVLGYSPNFVARALAARRTNTIGAIIPTMDNAIFARGIQAFQEELSLHGMTLLIASSTYSRKREEEQIRTMAARGAEALLLIGYDRSEEIYTFLRSRNIPFVIAWAYDETRPYISVGFDNEIAMGQLINEVIALGHRQLGFISAPMADNDRARNRVKAVRDAMQTHGIDPDSLQLIQANYSIENGSAAAKSLLQGPRPPTAILCGNDVLAIGAVRGAKNLGLRVPEDISITGFDDIELALLSEPPLATVHVPHREMGRRAALALVNITRGNMPAQTSTRLDTTLQLRASLGPAKV